MATAQQSRNVDTSEMVRLPRIRPEQGPVQMPPQLPMHLTQSTVMIAALPAIQTQTDGIIRQFYGGARVPTRRVILP